MKTLQTKLPLTIYYDGNCIVCSTEINYYRNLKHEDRLHFIDISSADFKASNHDRTHDEFMARMHVKDADGNFHVGVDSFPAIWSALPNPGYRLLARIIQLPGVHFIATCGYALFARFRKYLPKDHRCDDSICKPRR